MDFRFLTAILLATVFTIALTFATVEAPHMVNFILSPLFPDLGWHLESIEEFMGYARPIGYASLAIVATLIIVGFVGGRKLVSSLGSIAIFLPTFGYFAYSMFFLAGVGVLRVLWIPFRDLSPQFMKLGDVAYLPYMILVYPFYLAGLDIRKPLSLIVVGLEFLYS